MLCLLLLVLAPAALGRSHGTAGQGLKLKVKTKQQTVHPVAKPQAEAKVAVAKPEAMQPEAKQPEAKRPKEIVIDQKAIERNLKIIFLVASFVVGVFVVMLGLCCFYDFVALWQHNAYFNTCRKQVQSVHDMFLKPHWDSPLCPICIEHVPKTASNSVIFLCGHRFHTECANRWFLSKVRTGERCPICHSVDDSMNDRECEDGEVLPDHAHGLGTDAKNFFLQSLSVKFPEIISKNEVRRWCKCHTEIWLSELDCPRYKSIFSLRKGEK